ncbi:P-loop containing nucleoside triphosphate hydrolase protein [Penicillium cosmopolitanum]|uniref:P-loop containing nucleoside triphosphate hydrolase protein n=1 Tax=Penicillium cosmopolitanum TaxID=1131564 RepID=A0A9W9W0T3_9EURO|nr:P-loop containing nucleoside triphosphate hydrolase protein [Penicillium cosmopolitanum]KAJ5394738.1 P-loop containing nucleoside triphosphate hydrolase protein [Penicillium cosmopolitanum]
MSAINGGVNYHSPPQMSLMDVMFPGLGVLSASAQQLLAGNLDSYTRLFCTLGIFVLFARYAVRYVWDIVKSYFTSTIYVSYYDEAYDMLVDWIADQPFVHNAHSLIARVRSTQRTSNVYSTKKKPVTFSPWDGSFLFWYKGHLLVLHCHVKEHREDLRISSIGLNANILKSLIEECREKYLKDTQRKVSVFEHRDGEWKKARLRPVRPISTVIMDNELKSDVLKDVDEFLDQDMQGCFSLSLAGKHGLDIYTLQLSNISDSTLMKLFSELPPHCIVLLEDVDTAGVGRRDSVDADHENESKSAVTLSGLLNVLDGVSSQEGRILIMTTNHIEHLDEALIRPGRSDKKIHFKLADQNISTQLFRTVFKQMPNQNQCNEEYDDETIEAFARDFASKVPDQVFSPAEVLSFLLECKKSPSDAVSCVESWVVKAKY